jgi:predicted  nucleic acid-binding Zn-ribbon protein
MGRGQIISGGEDGLYRVKLIHDRERLNKMLADLAAKKTAAQETRADVQAEWNDLKPQVDTATTELTSITQELADAYSQMSVWQEQLSSLNMDITALENELSDAQEDNATVVAGMRAIEAENPDTYEDDEEWQLLQQTLVNGESNIDAIQNQIDALKEQRDQLNNDIGDLQKEIDELNETYTEQEKEASDLAYDLALLDQRLSAIDLDITAIDKRVDYLNTECPEDETIAAWCADLTEDLSGTVGTVEVPGEKQVVQIQPGYEGNAAYDEDRDGQLFFTPAMTPAQAFYNFAMLPGWQMWKPLFRYGTITAISEAGLASVTLDASMVSSGQDLGINQTATLTGVGFEYMSCDHVAFEAGDEVLIMFANQQFENPKIIGFKEEPQPCGPWPAIEAYDGEYGSFVGVVLCQGGGFNPPYTFVPKDALPEDDPSDPAGPLPDERIWNGYEDLEPLGIAEPWLTWEDSEQQSYSGSVSYEGTVGAIDYFNEGENCFGESYWVKAFNRAESWYQPGIIEIYDYATDSYISLNMEDSFYETIVLSITGDSHEDARSGIGSWPGPGASITDCGELKALAIELGEQDAEDVTDWNGDWDDPVSKIEWTRNNIWRLGLVQNPGEVPEYTNSWAGSITTTVKKLWNWDGSVLNADEFVFIYTDQVTVTSEETTNSDSAHPVPVDDDTVGPTHIALDGTVMDVPYEGNRNRLEDGWGCKYFHLDDLSIGLLFFSLESAAGDGCDYQFAYASVNRVTGESELIVTRFGNDERSIIPDVTDLDGNPIWHHGFNCFRMIRSEE